MQKIIFFMVFILGCSNNQDKSSRYTKEQIASMHLESTQLAKIDTTQFTQIDLTPFLQKQSFNFGTLVKDLKLIPLETLTNGLVDGIKKIIVTDSFIYIHDKYKNGGVVIFDNNGKFIKRIPNGKGPGELIRLYDLDFDKERNKLIVYKHSFLMFFTPSGHFLYQRRLPFGFYNFVAISGGYAFKTIERQNDHLEKFKNYSFFITDSNFRIKSAGLKVLPNKNSYEANSYLYKSQNWLSVTQKKSDTIYEYVSEYNLLKARYVMCYNNKKLPESYWHVTWKEFERTVRNNDFYFNVGRYNENESNNVFFLSNWHIDKETIVFRDKKSGHLIGGTSANFDLNEIPSIAFTWWAFKDYFVAYYLPGKKDYFAKKSSIISAQDKLKIKNLTEEDNPVIVLYRLKNF